jgi:N6-adenosine-specific RNA methylase IME4
MIALPTTTGGYRASIIDPPWRFKSNSPARPGRNALRHYACMSLDEIAALPVGEIMARNSMIALWITGAFLAVGAHLPILKTWGFRPSTILTWVKTRPNVNFGSLVDINAALAIGTGLTFRANAEFVVLAVRGRSIRRDAGVLGTFLSPRRRHSEKPPELGDMVERYTGSVGPYVELFARRARPNWVTWGDQVGLFDDADSRPAEARQPTVRHQEGQTPLADADVSRGARQ